MIIGSHSVISSTNPDADRAFLRDVLQFTHIDAGEGWLIFGLPPSEVAVHPSKTNGVHEFYLLCDDVMGFVADMTKRRVVCGPVLNVGWGILTKVMLPGGGELGVYQPRHARPKPMDLRSPAKRAVAKPGKPARKVVKKKQATKVAKSVARRPSKKS